MLPKKISEYLAFFRRSVGLLANDKGIFFAFVALSIVAALTEGMTISLLIPILEAQGQGGFSSIPILGHVSAPFAQFSPNGRVIAIAVAMAAMIMLRNLLQYGVDALSNVLPVRLERRLNTRSFAMLMDVEIAYIHQREYGTLANAVGNWARWVGGLVSSVAMMISNAFILLVYFMMMLAVSWQLTLPAIIFLFLVSLTLKYFSSGPLHRAGTRLSVATARVNQLVMESIMGIKMVRLAAAEPQMRQLHSRALEEATASQRRSALIQALSSPIFSTAAGLFVCLLLLVNAVFRTVEPSVWLGSVLLFLFLLFRLMSPVSNLNIARSRIVTHMPAFDCLTEFYRDTADRKETNGRLQAGHLRHGVVFDRVGFSYGSADGPILVEFSLHIERGQTVAIVGRSGAGKSTLIGLLARFWDPQQGRILIDGVDLREFDRRSWRKRLSVVTQDAFIFNDTVANNIRFGRADAPMELIRKAATLASAAEFIDELPDGYETILGDRGVRLSGGQQQRIAIARAVLAAPDILILDEATSHLDTFTERAIQNAVEKIAKERTVIVIAHRLSTIRKADKVVVIDDGRIVEEGPHFELLSKRGAYWEMIEHQRLDLVQDIDFAAVEKV
jgi:ATP-binding cassette, subfamily B, bacterial MsbA